LHEPDSIGRRLLVLRRDSYLPAVTGERARDGAADIARPADDERAAGQR
jgi:hypothetical protein